MSTFESRLKEERQRLGFNQTDFAEMAGVQKRAQINYEKGERSPDGVYLAAIATAGADIQYIVTGVRSSVALAPDERMLVERYRSSPLPLKDAALRMLLIGEEPAKKPRGGMVFNGEVSGGFTNVEGNLTQENVTFNVGKK